MIDMESRPNKRPLNPEGKPKMTAYEWLGLEEDRPTDGEQASMPEPKSKDPGPKKDYQGGAIEWSEIIPPSQP